MSSSSTTPYVARGMEDDDNDARSIVSESVAPSPTQNVLLEGLSRMIADLCTNVGTIMQTQTSLQNDVQGLMTPIQVIEENEERMSPITNPGYRNISDALPGSARLATSTSSTLRSLVRVTPETDAEVPPFNLRRSE